MSETRIAGWARAFAIIMGFFVIIVGFSAIFYPAIVAGFVTALFSIAFIMLGLWALAIGISGQRVASQTPVAVANTSSTQPASSMRKEGITA
ncbi:MAG: hypothetical protein ACHQ1H_08135 [Nitrososphaerales archaeon]